MCERFALVYVVGPLLAIGEQSQQQDGRAS